MDWMFLILAGIGEMGGVTFLGFYTDKKNKMAIIAMILSFAFSLGFLSLALQTIPMSIGYSIWTGIGAAGGAIMNMWLFDEPRSWVRGFFIFLIIFAVVGLKFAK
ncbi:DMT family transporter [Companilactobacillus furfuricola]|uniref:DMT family transporter n=1 Tax=Companilactobacillus furfuricola TaxID=1462575 RepID=UPI000F768B46|nr:multidrug efflux SMR transporter [Companilactobacillus furfuricola]